MCIQTYPNNTMCLIWYSLIILLGLVNKFIFYISLFFLFYKLIHKPQVYINCINAKLWLQAGFSIDFAFLYFLIFFPFLFSPYWYSLDHVLSVNFIQFHICRPKQTKSSVGRTTQEWIQGYEWRVVAPVTHHKCSEC